MTDNNQLSIRTEHPDRGYGSMQSGLQKFKQFAVFMAMAFLLIPLLAPAFDSPQVHAEPTALENDYSFAENQSISVEAINFATQDRDGYSATKPVVVVPRLAMATDADVRAAQEYARGLVSARGWGDEHFSCLLNLWQRESGWRYTAENRSSGAYGIPQALPGSKMASAGADWRTNPQTQIRWGMGYVEGRYGSPCGAWNFFLNRGWY